jgi:hypothetical protein
VLDDLGRRAHDEVEAVADPLAARAYVWHDGMMV